MKKYWLAGVLAAVAIGAAYMGSRIGSEFSIPDTITPEARQAFDERFNSIDARMRRAFISLPDNEDAKSWKELQQMVESAVAPFNQAIVEQLQPTIEKLEIGGVGVLDIRSANWQDNGKVLLYLHGGAYVLYSANSTLLSSVSMAHDSGMRVISVDYTLAPFADFESIQAEVVKVVRGLLALDYSLADIAIYGDSAGGGLAAATALRLRDQGLGLPAALVLWSPWSDVSGRGDTYDTLKDSEPTYLYDPFLRPAALAYAPESEFKNPYVSPVYGDFTQGYPPTLIQAGTKEIFLSDVVRLYQTIDQAGGNAKLDLYEGMWHVFQVHNGVPEADTARIKAANFLRQHLLK